VVKITQLFLIGGLVVALPVLSYGAGPSTPNDFSALFLGGEEPVIVSFSVRPYISADLPQIEANTVDSPGLAVGASVAAGDLQGGLSYFQGDALESSSPQDFASYYFYKGLSATEGIILLPNAPADDALPAPEAAVAMQAISLYGGYELTPSLKIKGAFLLSKAKTDSEITDQAPLDDTSYSWVLDVGADYKLNNSVTYSFNFGYADGAGSYSDFSAENDIQQNVYLFKNHINMSF
jgi:hypothetical protein